MVNPEKQYSDFYITMNFIFHIKFFTEIYHIVTRVQYIVKYSMKLCILYKITFYL